MLFAKLHSAVSAELEDAKEDYSAAKRIGQYKFSAEAVYLPDGTYVPFGSVAGAVSDRSSVHVAGCCAGGVPVERLVLTAEDKKVQLLFDSKKEIEKAIAILAGAGITPEVKEDNRIM